MADFLTNDSYNVIPSQTSDLNCSQYVYPNPPGKKGTQTGTSFYGPRAAFTSNMKGGLICFASNADGESYSYNAMILEVVDSKTLTLDVDQNITETDYTIWYGGVQFDQKGNISVQSLSVNGAAVVPGLTAVNAILLDSLTSATYTPTAGTRYMLVEGVGAGGGGGSVELGPNACVGGGAGSGGYFRYVGVAESFTYQCGTGGLGGNLTVGDTGTATTISAGVSIPAISAGGGFGGGKGDVTRFTLGGDPGSVTGAPISLIGESGYIGWTYVTAESTDDYGISGRGANSFFGNGGAEVAASGTASVNGNNAFGYGAGGSGGVRVNSVTVPLGGNGTQGVIFVTEFI